MLYGYDILKGDIQYNNKNPGMTGLLHAAPGAKC